MAERSIESLAELPEATDPVRAAAIGALLQTAPAAFISQQSELFALIGLEGFRLTLETGRTPYLPGVLALYALITRNLEPDPRVAFALSSLAERLAERDSPPLLANAGFVHSWFVHHWVEPIPAILPRIPARAEAGFTHGDVMMACFNTAGYVTLLAASGAPLDEVIAAGHRRGRADRRSRRRRGLPLHPRGPVRQGARGPHHRPDLAHRRPARGHGRRGARPRLDPPHRPRQPAGLLPDLEAAPALLLPRPRAGRWPSAIRPSASAARSGRSSRRSSSSSSTGSRCWPTPARPATRRRSRGASRRSRRCAPGPQFAPALFEPRVAIMEGQLAWARADRGLAVERFTTGAAGADRHHAALAHELAGRCLLEAGDAGAAREQLRAAADGYADWGAAAKVEDVLG